MECFCQLTESFLLWFRTRVIPENIIKRQERVAKLAKAVVERRAAEKKQRAESRKTAAANAQKYFNEYTQADSALIEARRQAKAAGNFYVEEQPKVMFIVRIRG